MQPNTISSPSAPPPPPPHLTYNKQPNPTTRTPPPPHKKQAWFWRRFAPFNAHPTRRYALSSLVALVSAVLFFCPAPAFRLPLSTTVSRLLSPEVRTGTQMHVSPSYVTYMASNATNAAIHTRTRPFVPPYIHIHTKLKQALDFHSPTGLPPEGGGTTAAAGESADTAGAADAGLLAALVVVRFVTSGTCMITRER